MVFSVKCRKCGGSHVIKFGHRNVWSRGKRKRVQAYQCQHCGAQFQDYTTSKGRR